MYYMQFENREWNIISKFGFPGVKMSKQRAEFERNSIVPCISVE